jgi:hypothetical protein
MAGDPGDWDCTAYGPEVRAAGALCFFAELNERVCASPEECRSSMAAERQRVFRRISELSAAGDPTGVFLEGEFSNPGQLLDNDQQDRP